MGYEYVPTVVAPVLWNSTDNDTTSDTGAPIS